MSYLTEAALEEVDKITFSVAVVAKDDDCYLKVQVFSRSTQQLVTEQSYLIIGALAEGYDAKREIIEGAIAELKEIETYQK